MKLRYLGVALAFGLAAAAVVWCICELRAMPRGRRARPQTTNAVHVALARPPDARPEEAGSRRPARPAPASSNATASARLAELSKAGLTQAADPAEPLDARMRSLYSGSREITHNADRWRAMAAVEALLSNPEDVARATAFWDGVTTSDADRAALAVGIAAKWAEFDPAAATAWALDAASNWAVEQELGTSPLEAAIGKWVEANPAAAAGWAEQMAGRGARQVAVLRHLFPKWATVDPETAFASALTANLDPPRRAQAVRAVVSTWAKTDPQAAWQKCSELPPEQVTPDLRQVIASELARSDPAQAATIAQGIPEGIEREAAMRDVAISLARSDVKGALEFYVSVPTVRADPTPGIAAQIQADRAVRAQEFASSVVPAAAVQMAHENPRQAIVWFLEYAGQVPDARKTLRTLVGEWAGKEPRKVLEWLSGQPGGAPLDLLEFSLETWSRTDPNSVGAYLDELDARDPSVPVQKLAQEMKTRIVARRDGAQAALQIENARFEFTSEALADVLTRWTEQDPRAAAKWVEEKLPPGERRSLAIRAVERQWTLYDRAEAEAWVKSLERAN